MAKVSITGSSDGLGLMAVACWSSRGMRSCSMPGARRGPRRPGRRCRKPRRCYFDHQRLGRVSPDAETLALQDRLLDDCRDLSGAALA